VVTSGKSAVSRGSASLVISVVVPAPFGPMTARISPGASASDRLLMA